MTDADIGTSPTDGYKITAFLLPSKQHRFTQSHPSSVPSLDVQALVVRHVFQRRFGSATSFSIFLPRAHRKSPLGPYPSATHCTPTRIPLPFPHPPLNAATLTHIHVPIHTHIPSLNPECPIVQKLVLSIPPLPKHHDGHIHLPPRSDQRMLRAAGLTEGRTRIGEKTTYSRRRRRCGSRLDGNDQTCGVQLQLSARWRG
ncbi:hypothetical protein P171DRAFT_435130 [Karstenula rhodostoma CBS 690.94]|uniref:Uncharacterized protein n=1 Tax=Karstenula rhodostoma CBS 690.94 TaxID=1392251 RepID=A0A9P4PBD7_9PLEO|nr:hypothetical protein P171DRAFT_435130 [Karstenula rhodostoma CBS 690.94]